MHDLCHRLLLRPQTLVLLHLQLEEILAAAVEPYGNAAEFSVVSILAHVEKLEILSILDEPNVVSLLGGLAGAVDGVDSDIFAVLGLPRMNHHHNMHIIPYSNFP